MFYHDKKEHMSPSAMQSWLHSRGSFIKSYFREERGIETKSMAFGTKVHALIEGGMLNATQVYDHNEAELRFEVEPDSGLYFMGKPDSYSDPLDDEGVSSVEFVDYKSGKTNSWNEKLPTDIKMLATAWLVWRASGKPDVVNGYVEFIETVWDEELHDVKIVEGTDTVVMARRYTWAEMENFTQAILKAMSDVNAFYKKWEASSGEFVRQDDIDAALKLRARLATIEAELEEVEDRIASQMEFGGEETHKLDGLGTYYFKTTDAWEYPEELEFVLDGAEKFTLGKAERVASGVKAVKKNYELVNEPATSKKTLAYRAAIKKK